MARLKLILWEGQLRNFGIKKFRIVKGINDNCIAVDSQNYDTMGQEKWDRLQDNDNLAIKVMQQYIWNNSEIV